MWTSDALTRGCRDNVAATLVGLLSAPNTVSKTITLIDGVQSITQALASVS